MKKAEGTDREDFPVLGDEVGDVVLDGELAGADGEGHQVVVVDEVVAAERDEHERVVHDLRRRVLADERRQLLLVLPEVLQLLPDPDDVHLQTKRNVDKLGAPKYSTDRGKCR